MPTLITPDIVKISDLASDARPALALASISGEPYFVIAVKGKSNPSDAVYIGNYPFLNGPVPGTQTDVAPGLACLNTYTSTKLYVAWKVAGESSVSVLQCVIAVDDFQSTGVWTSLPIAEPDSGNLVALTDAAPVLAIGANNQLYAAWKTAGTAPGEFTAIGWSVYDGSGWSAPKYTSAAAVPPITTNVNPSIALATPSQDSLCIGYTDASNEVLFFSPESPSGLGYVPGVLTDAGPALTLGLPGSSYLVWKGMDLKTFSFVTLPLNNSDPTIYLLPQVQSDGGPAAAAWVNSSTGFGAEEFSSLALAWKDIGSNDIWLGSWNLLPDAVPVPIRGLGGNYNYVFSANCTELTKVSVTVEITKDLIPETNNGFGFQLNCHTPTLDMNPKSGWQQYAILIDAQGNAIGLVNEWDQARTVTIDTAVSLCTLPSPTLPEGYKLTIALEFDPNSHKVTGVNFHLITKTGKQYHGKIALLSQNLYRTTTQVTSDYLGPIVAFEFEIVGYDYDQTTNFSSGEGTIKYTSNVPLTPSGSVPTCALELPGTGELSNTLYAELSSTPNNPIEQFFCVNPAPLP